MTYIFFRVILLEMDSILTRLAVIFLFTYVDVYNSEKPFVQTVAIHNKSCKITEFKCVNNRCIQLNQYCNNNNDCGDSSDEPRYCTSKYIFRYLCSLNSFN